MKGALDLFAASWVLREEERIYIHRDHLTDIAGIFNESFLTTAQITPWTCQVLNSAMMERHPRAERSFVEPWRLFRMDKHRIQLLFFGQDQYHQARAELREPLVPLCPEPLSSALENHQPFVSNVSKFHLRYGLAEERTQFLAGLQNALLELRGL